MGDHPQLIKKTPHTDHTDANWRNGSLRYDLSHDEELAKAGDEKAKARLRTKRRLASARLSPQSI